MGSDSYNQLDSIAKGGIHQATQGLTHCAGQFLCRKAQQGCEGNNRKEVQDEDGGGVPLQGSRENPQWDKDQQNIDVVADQGQPGQTNNMQRPLRPGALVVGMMVVTQMVFMIVAREARQGTTWVQQRGALAGPQRTITRAHSSSRAEAVASKLLTKLNGSCRY